MSDRSDNEYLQARRLLDQFPLTLEDKLCLACISKAREQDHKCLLQFYCNFLTFRPRQLALCFPPETLFNLEHNPRFEVWTDHSTIVRNLYKLLEFKVFSQTELDRFVDSTLPSSTGWKTITCDNITDQSGSSKHRYNCGLLDIVFYSYCYKPRQIMSIVFYSSCYRLGYIFYSNYCWQGYTF